MKNSERPLMFVARWFQQFRHKYFTNECVMSFPCDENGKVDLRRINKDAKPNYIHVLNNIELYDVAIVNRSYYHRNGKYAKAHLYTYAPNGKVAGICLATPAQYGVPEWEFSASQTNDLR